MWLRPLLEPITFRYCRMIDRVTESVELPDMSRTKELLSRIDMAPILLQDSFECDMNGE